MPFPLVQASHEGGLVGSSWFHVECIPWLAVGHVDIEGTAPTVGGGHVRIKKYGLRRRGRARLQLNTPRNRVDELRLKSELLGTVGRKLQHVQYAFPARGRSLSRLEDLADARISS